MIVEYLQPSAAFYVDKLGFQVRHIGPADDPRHPWASWDAFISTADPDLLFEEYNSRGLAFRQPLTDNHDGLRGFELEDADG